jgi:predicted RNase H-like HicB family nuclease
MVTFSQPQPTMLEIECDREIDGRWIAEVPTLPGVMVYGLTQEDAIAKVKALSLRVLADRLEHGEAIPDSISFMAAA